MLSNKMKRCLSFLAAMIMLISLMPASALAADEEVHDHSVDAAEEATQENSVTEEPVTSELAEEVKALLAGFQAEANRIIETYLGTIELSAEEVPDRAAKLAQVELENAAFEILLLNEDFVYEFKAGAFSESVAQEFVTSNPVLMAFADYAASYLPEMTLYASGTYSPATGVSISVTDSTSCSYEGGVLTVTAKGASKSWTNWTGTKKTATFDVTATNSGSTTRRLFYKWNGTTVYSMKIDNADTSQRSGSVEVELAPGATVTKTFWMQTDANDTVNTLTLSEFSFADVAESAQITVKLDTGSVTAGGKSVANNDVVTVPGSGMTFSASESNFVAWIDTATNSILSATPSFTYKPTGNATIKALYGPTAYFTVGGKLYETLSAASTAAKSGSNKNIILYNTGTLPAGTHTIDSGVTLVIPYSDTASSNSNPLTEPDRVAEKNTYVNPTAFRTLTVPSGATINCAGNIRVDGRQYSASTQYTGHVYGAYGKIALEGTINLTGSATLRAYGYITGNGTVNAAGTAAVYELFQMADWRGGNNTSSLYGGMKGDSFLISCFYIQNIESKLVINSGANLITYVTIAAGIIGDKSPYNSSAKVIASDGLFQLDSGAKATRSISGGRVTYKVEGNSSMGSITLKLSTGIGSFNMNSSEYILNLPSSMTVQYVSGTATIPVSAKLLPGAVIQVDSGATVKLTGDTELVIYDVDDWKSGNYTYTSNFFAPKYSVGTKMSALPSTPGQLIVNGTLEVNDTAAIYSTNKTNAASGNAGLSGTGVIKINGAPGTARTTVKEISGSSTTKVDVAVTSLLAKQAGLTTIPDKAMTKGNTYYGTSGGYWYTNIVTVDGDASKITITDSKGVKASKSALDKREGTVVAVAAPSGTVSFTVASGYKATVGSTEYAAGTTQTLTVTKDTVIKVQALCTHEYEGAWVWNENGGYTLTLTCKNCAEGTDGRVVTKTGTGTEVAGKVNPTCEANGSVQYTATVEYNGQTFTNTSNTFTLPALGHNFKGTVKDDGNGTHSFLCKNGCGKYGGAAAHTPATDDGDCTTAIQCTVCKAVTTAAKDAHTPAADDGDCTTAIKCSVCGTVTTAAKTHSMMETATAVAATCTTAGKTAVQSCQNAGCNHTTGGATIAALGHDYTNAEVTYSWTGYTACVATRKCVRSCGETETANATITNAVTTAATCKDTGVRTYTATFSKDWAATQTTTETIAINSEAHAWDNACDTTCNNGCGETRETKHSYGDWVVTSEPTCEDTGVQTKTCSVCGDKQTQSVEATGHRYQTEVTAPTCEAQGYTTYTCTCGDTYVADYVDALGHSYSSNVTTEATCTAAGVRTYTCTCGDSYTEAIPQLAHSFNKKPSSSVKTEATCTANRTVFVQCDNCTAVSTDKTVEVADTKLAHAFNAKASSKEATPATCTANRTVFVQCDNCTAVSTDKTVEVADTKLAHTYETVVTPPTFEAQGFTTHTCSKCSDSYVDSYTAQLTAVAQIVDGEKYQTLAEAIAAAKSGDTIVLLADAQGATGFAPMDLKGATLSLNGKTLTGSVAGTVQMNGGTLVTFADNDTPITMAGPENSGAMYITSNAVFVLGTDWRMTVASGSASLGQNWQSMPGQKVVIASDANVTIPADKTFTIRGTVIVEEGAELTCEGTIVLGYKNATLTVAKDLNVTVAADLGDCALYDENTNTYSIHSHTAGAAADCENAQTCTECGAELEAAKGHTLTAVEAKAPTCTEAGYEAYEYCTACDYTTFAEVDATGHNYATDVTAPTCTEQGYTTYTCTCGDTYVADYVDATGHTYTSAETQAPTCTEAGVMTFTCACGDTYTEAIAARGHALVNVEAMAPTCTEAGYEAYEYCTACDYTTFAEVDATGHNYATDVTAPSCTEQGYTTYTCTCGDTYVADYVNAKGHTYTSAETQAPTCTEAGVMTYTCACGDTYTEEIAAKGHTLTAVEAKAPTCTEAGYEAYEYCSVCDYTTYEEVAATNHQDTTEDRPGTAPTCQNAGVAAGTFCTACNTYITGGGELPTVAHSYTNYVSNNDATCQKNCTETGACSYGCGTKDTREIADSTVDHSFTNYVSNNDATCTKDCTETASCDFGCKTVDIRDIENSKAAHSYHVPMDSFYKDKPEKFELIKNPETEEYVGANLLIECKACGHQETITAQKIDKHVDSTPTCTEAGKTTYTASFKYETYEGSWAKTYTYGPLEHNTDGKITHQDATCTEPGVVGGTYCTRCGEGKAAAETVIPATGAHTGGSATCEEKAACTVCGQEYGELATHTLTFVKTVPATCLTNGTKDHWKCEYCDSLFLDAEGETPVTADQLVIAKSEEHTWADACDSVCEVEGCNATRKAPHQIENTEWSHDETNHWKVCELCKNEIGQEAHNFVDGKCEVCDAVAPKEKFNIAAAQIIMGNNLDMMFAIPKTAVEDWTGYYAEIVHEYADGRADDVQTIPYSEFGTSGSFYTVTYTGLAAKEMADALTVTVYDSNHRAVSNDWVDSVRAYAIRNYNLKGSKDSDAKVAAKKKMIVDMLNYGAEAQKKFNYNVNDLANSVLTADQLANGTQTVELNQGLATKHLASQLILESNISFWIAIKNLDTTMSATIEFTDHNGKNHVEEIAGKDFGKSGNVMYVASKEIAIADARQVLTITVYNEDGTVFVQTQDSIEDYLARSINKATNAANKDLYYSVMKFADSAKEYLHTN